MDEPTYLGLTESEVRKLRDTVLYHQSSDVTWSHTRQYWLQGSEVEWLREKSKRPLRVELFE